MEKSDSIVHNIIYNILSQAVTLVVPLITAPYIARVFNADLIGEYSFALANSLYFVLFSNLGLALYGQLKVAAIRNNIWELSSFFFELSSLKFLLLCLSVFLYCIIIVLNSDGMSRNLALIMLFNIVSSGIDTTWFFNGMELFKFLAIRNVAVRVINLLLILLIIKKQEDILTYALIMQITPFVFSILLFPYAIKHIRLVTITRNGIFKHFIPSLIYFVPGLVNTIFSSADKTMLGIMTNKYEVGVYEQANKISQILLSSISAIGNVILPRAAYIYNNASENGYDLEKKLLYKSLCIVVFVSIPVVFCICSISENFVNLFFGVGYEKSGTLLIILSFNVLFACIGNILGQQCLIARNKQGEYNICVVASAIINVFLNIVFIKYYASIGAAVASIVAGALICIFIMKKSDGLITYSRILKMSWQYFVVAVLFCVVTRNFISFIDDSLVKVITGLTTYLLGYISTLYLLKDQMLCELINNFKYRIDKV